MIVPATNVMNGRELCDARRQSQFAHGSLSAFVLAEVSKMQQPTALPWARCVEPLAARVSPHKWPQGNRAAPQQQLNWRVRQLTNKKPTGVFAS